MRKNLVPHKDANIVASSKIKVFIMYRSESEEDFKILQKRKWVILGINGIVFLVAFAMVCICFWIRFDLDFREWVQEMDW